VKKTVRAWAVVEDGFMMPEWIYATRKKAMHHAFDENNIVPVTITYDDGKPGGQDEKDG